MKETSLGMVMAEVTSVEKVESTDRLYIVKLLGNDRQYQVATSLASYYPMSELIGKQVPLKVDVEPKVIYGIESNARFVAILNNGKPVLLVPESPVPNGALVI